jgi:hypothetical protein
MFDSAPRAQSPAEQAREAASKRVSAAAQYARQTDTWFDGSIDSVDRRLAMCDKLLHQARHELGVGGLGNPTAFARLASLETDRGGLTSLREDLATGYAYREASSAVVAGRSAAKRLEALHPVDRRYVELEAPKLVRQASGCRDLEELAVRARYVAAEDTSAFSQRRAAAVTEALVARTVQLARRTRPARTASAPRPVEDFPAELMYG